jgi:hypothetical protein
MQEKERKWVYFSEVLTSSDIWKLHFLQADVELMGGDLSKVSSYVDCAYHLSDNLTKLNLTQEMNDIEDNLFKWILEFKKLKSLIITNLFKTYQEFSRIMTEYLPSSVEEIEIESLDLSQHDVAVPSTRQVS